MRFIRPKNPKIHIFKEGFENHVLGHKVLFEMYAHTVILLRM
jgi:hypothetical protein